MYVNHYLIIYSALKDNSISPYDLKVVLKGDLKPEFQDYHPFN